jgi:hypothetical protein
MKRDIKIKINLDLTRVEELNSIITENYIIYQKYAKKKNKHGKEMYQWNKLTAIIFHLRETGEYLNSSRMIFNFNDEYIRYKFIEFLNLSTQIHEFIMMLYDLFGIDRTEIEKTQKHFRLTDFRKYYGENEFTDVKFLQYIRSLTAIHPLSTDRHVNKGFQGGLEFSPYIDPISTFSRILHFPQVFNTAKDPGAPTQLSIKVTHGNFEKSPIYNSAAETKKKYDKQLEEMIREQITTSQEVEIFHKQMDSNLEEQFNNGLISKEEYRVMRDSETYGNDRYILVDIKNFISFTESRYKLIEDLIYKIKEKHNDIK